MKHQKTPRWVEAATAPRAQKRSCLILSDMIGRLEVHCAVCDRRGLYRVDRLVAELGDLPLTDALSSIARNGGCNRALNPPAPTDILAPRCQIKRVS